MDELKEHARELPPASRARGDSHHMMRRHHISPRYYATYNAPMMDDMRYDKLTFHPQRGSLDGALVWYWTYNGMIVRVDV
ncbi:hypothetical protein [Rhizobium leguminosarum]|uniref:hypothetical protein n=1 Tax=Rhizobium leguminosarum TaxID=384 RepID=UPI001C955DFF|nr:hypothetical protein [Rhizobium leguminosarum]MBY5581838.1 hypothetical protein [Rhizobium leguminosarum]